MITSIRYREMPAWVPEGARPPVGVVRKVRIAAPVRRVMRKRRAVSVSGWAARHRVLTMGRYAGMRWRNALTPYLPGIMDTAAAPGVQVVIVCKAPQIGVSEAAHNYVAWAIDMRPGPVLYVYPDQKTGRENAQDRIIPMLKKSRRLREYLTGLEYDETKHRIRLKHMPIYIGWAGSAAALGNKPIRHLIFDELDKYIDKVGKETDPVALGEKRTITYQWMRCIWKISTPTVENGFIWRAITEEADVVMGYRARCPLCGDLSEMAFGDEGDGPGIHWPRAADGSHPEPREVVKSRSAWYECPGCGGRWDDRLRDEAVAAGGWWSREVRDKSGEVVVPAMPLRAYLKRHRPRAVGFHVPSWMSRFRSLSEACAPYIQYLRSNKTDKSALKNFRNQECAEPWVDYAVERSEQKILALRDDRPRLMVPGPGVVAGMTAAIDTQDNGFWYEVRAWDFVPSSESWQVAEGFAPTFDALVEICRTRAYLDPDGNRYHVMGALIDSAGHRTLEVYTFCGMYPNFFIPIVGTSRMTTRYKVSGGTLTYPGTNKPVPGSPKLYRINVTMYKNDLNAKLQIRPDDPGAWHLHAQTDEDWAAQMCAEVRDEKTGLWINPRKRPNHAWDVSVYNLAARDIFLHMFPSAPPKDAADRKTHPAEQHGAKRRRRW